MQTEFGAGFFGTCLETGKVTTGYFELLVLETVFHKLKNNFLFYTKLRYNFLMVRKEAPVSSVQPKPGMVSRQIGSVVEALHCVFVSMLVLAGDVL